MKKAFGIFGIVAAVLAILAGFERWMGRSVFGPDGKPGLWEGSIWSSECSQRLADAYSFSHIGHGFVFFALLWLVARRVPLRFRYLAAVIVEAGWEMLENSPIIINRYRDATMALGYSGDSIFNSLSDVLMMSFGFLLAWRLPVWASVVLFLAMEIGCALWVRDNLTLNVIMLIHPIEAIKLWQMGGHP
ncbi:MAG: DUF2585 family protein [Verrucomicrobiaceae bacterium]|nr:MAG: DUF2585 family protein [Verrucomicrobiaceae bacterium]